MTNAISRTCRQSVADPQLLTMSAILDREEPSDLEKSFDYSQLSAKLAGGISSNLPEIGKVSLIFATYEHLSGSVARRRALRQILLEMTGTRALSCARLTNACITCLPGDQV
jgi:hypothetical protein